MESLQKFLNEHAEACKARAAALTADNRQDEAVFEKIRGNVFEIFTAVLNTARKQPEPMAFFRRQLPVQRLETARGVKANLFSTLGKWLRAELTLLLITFAQLLLGFFLLHEPYALLLAFVICLIDALPVLGTGTVLLPWAIGCFLLDNIPRGIALVALYTLITLVRSIMEPRIMASQVGLPPLVALVALYVGFCVMGVGGMLLFPVALLFIKQLHDGGYLKLWK